MIDTATAAEFASLGAVVRPEDIEDDADDFEVVAENWDSLRAFVACETQWRVAATFSGLIWLGLDYSAVEVVLRRRNCSDAAFEDLQMMERAAIAAFVEVSDG